MLARRDLLAACAAALAAPAWAADKRADELLDRAIAAAGGASALRRVTTLSWTGEAAVHTGGQELKLGVSTTVTPFRAARSETWLLAQGPASARTMVLEHGDLFQERAGVRTPLPAAQALHERQQYAIYGLMLFVPLKDHIAGLTMSGGLDVRHPDAPPTIFWFDGQDRLIRAANTVAAPDGGQPISQAFDFGGRIDSHGVHWPRRLSIRQNGEPYFDLTLRTFEAA